jgi:hypothetical protein
VHSHPDPKRSILCSEPVAGRALCRVGGVPPQTDAATGELWVPAVGAAVHVARLGTAATCTVTAVSGTTVTVTMGAIKR